MKVVSVVGQREIQNLVVGSQNIRLDILAKDRTGKHYNLEVQKKPEGAHIHRARFHSSMMDSQMLKESQKFSELSDSYMVVITQTDIFGHESRYIRLTGILKRVMTCLMTVLILYM